MKFVILHNKKSIEITINDTEWSLQKVKEAVSKETDIPVKELRIKVSGVEIETNESLPAHPVTIEFVDSRTLPSAQFSSLPHDISKTILQSIHQEIENDVELTKVNTQFNSVFKEMIFSKLEIPRQRENLNRRLKNKEQEIFKQFDDKKNRKMDDNIGYFKKKEIESSFKKITELKLSFISTLSYADGKRAYAAMFRFSPFDNYFKRHEKLFNFFLNRHSYEGYVREYSLFDSTLFEIMVREHELSILNDSSINKDKLAIINSSFVQEAISQRTASLLENKMDEYPFVAFQVPHNIPEMVLRFKNHNNARELMYALQKESYDFPNTGGGADKNYYNKFDTYPCEETDKSINQPHRFITTSSVTLRGIQNICNYIFATCELDKQQVINFLDIAKEKGISIENDIIYGFLSAFNKFFDDKMKEFQHKQKNTGLSHLFQNNSAISLKLEFLNMNKEELTHCYSDPFNKLDHFFKNRDFSKIDGKTLTHCQRFKDIFYEISQYQKLELSNNSTMEIKLN